jgi:hypothetical protein
VQINEEIFFIFCNDLSVDLDKIDNIYSITLNKNNSSLSVPIINFSKNNLELYYDILKSISIEKILTYNGYIEPIKIIFFHEFNNLKFKQDKNEYYVYILASNIYDNDKENWTFNSFSFNYNNPYFVKFLIPKSVLNFKIFYRIYYTNGKFSKLNCANIRFE